MDTLIIIIFFSYFFNKIQKSECHSHHDSHHEGSVSIKDYSGIDNDDNITKWTNMEISFDLNLYDDNYFSMDWVESLDTILIQKGSKKFMIFTFNYAYFHYMLKAISSKYSRLKKYINHDRKTAHFLLENIEKEIDNIHQIVNSIEYPNIEFFYRDKECFVLFSYSLIYSEYLIAKKVYFDKLDGNGEMKTTLEIEIKFHNRTYPLFVTAVEEVCTKDERTSKSHRTYGVQNLKDFVMIVLNLEQSLLKHRELLIEKYNNLILSYAANSFQQRNLETTKEYSNFLITESKLIDIIDEIFKSEYNVDDLMNIITLIDKFPVENSTVDAYIHLYGVAKRHGLLNSASVLVFERAIHTQTSIFKVLNFGLKLKVLEIYTLLSESSLAYAQLLAKIISKTEDPTTDNEKQQFIVNILESKSINKEYKIWCIEKVIENVYKIIPNQVSEICQFIKLFVDPEFIFAGYKKLLNILLLNSNKIYNMEILRLANYIREEPNEDFFTSLVDKLPVEIKHLIWCRRFTILNVAYKEYLVTSKDHFVNRKTQNLKEKINIRCAQSTKKYNSTLNHNHEFQWILKYNKYDNTFSVENFFGSYLTVGKVFNHKIFKIEFSTKRKTANVTKWKLQIVRNESNSINTISLQLFSMNSLPLYLFAASQKLDNNVRNVFISQVSIDSTTGAYWSLICSDKDKVKPKILHGDLKLTSLKIKRHVEDDGDFEHILPLHTTEDSIVLSFLKSLGFERIVQSNSLTDFRFHEDNFKRNSFKLSHFLPLEVIKVFNLNEKFRRFVILNIKISMMNIFSMYANFISSPPVDNVKITNESFHICKATFTDLMIDFAYFLVSNEITETINILHGENSTISKSVEVDKYNVFISSKNTFAQYIENIPANCTAPLKEFENVTLSKIKRTVNELLIKLTVNAFINYQFQVGVVYFQLLKNENEIFYIFKSMVDEILVHHGHFHHQDIKNFLTFVIQLYDLGKLTLETASNIFEDSYKILEIVTHITKSLRYLYIQGAHDLISRASGDHMTDYINSKLKKFTTDRKYLVFAELIMKENLTKKQENMLQREYRQYMNSQEHLIKLVNYMYKLKRKYEKDGFKRITRFLESLGLFNQDINQCFDELIRLMLLADRKETNREYINLAYYVFKTYDYIPCFHTGCVKNIDIIFPRFTKHFFENKLCRLQNVKYSKDLLVSKAYFVNSIEAGDMHNSLKPEIGDTKKPNRNNMWTFEYIEENDTFLLKSEQNLYLSMGKLFGNYDYRLSFLRNKYDASPIEWNIKLQKNKYRLNNFFTLRAANFKSVQLYLSATDYDSESGTSVLSNLRPSDDIVEFIDHGQIWRAFC